VGAQNQRSGELPKKRAGKALGQGLGKGITSAKGRSHRTRHEGFKTYKVKKWTREQADRITLEPWDEVRTSDRRVIRKKRGAKVEENSKGKRKEDPHRGTNEMLVKIKDKLERKRDHLYAKIYIGQRKRTDSNKEGKKKNKKNTNKQTFPQEEGACTKRGN